jgi:hypothetical protein
MNGSSTQVARHPDSKLVVKVVEDRADHAEQIKQALAESPIFDFDVYSTYKGRNVLEEAIFADIVSLDVEVDKNRESSKRMARHIRLRDPHKSVFFFAEDPKEVQGEPGHFVLQKVQPVWRAYGRLLVMIWTHDRCLSLLKATNDYFHNYDKEPYSTEFKKVFEKFQKFYPTLYWVVEATRELDPKMAETYLKLRDTLHGIADGIVFGRNFTKALAKVRRPLLEVVLSELRNIKEIEGVFTTHIYDSEIYALKNSIVSRPVGSRRRHPVMATKVFILESLSKSMRAFRDVLRLGEADRPLQGLPPDLRSPVGDPDIEGSPQSVGDEPAAATESADEEAALYLRAWFVDQEEDKLMERPLVVGETSSLLVNIIQILRITEGGFHDRLPDEVKSLINSVEYVDIVVSCPDAEVVPLRNRLFMPPDPDKPAKFGVTPRTEGDFDLTLMIMIRNEPVHRTVFLCCAVEAKRIDEAGEAENSHNDEPKLTDTPQGNSRQHARDYERGFAATESSEP